MNGTPGKKNGTTDSTRSNGKKRSRDAEDEDDSMQGDASSQRKRNGTPGSTKTGKAVYMRDEDDLDANEDDELAQGSKRNGLRRSKLSSSIGPQERKQENERRKEKARALAVETAALPVNTGE